VAEAPNILLTGGSGFIGGHLARYFAAAGCRVTLGVRPGRSTPGFASWRLEPEGELRLPAGIDAVVHAAATSPGPNVTVARMIDDNIGLTGRLIGAAQAANVRRFVLLSSMSVYGEIARPIVDEDTPILDPDAYGVTKRLSELLLEDDDTIAGLAIRLPAVVGRGAARHWLALAARQLADGSPVRFFHADAPFNNAIHVDDLAAFILDALRRGWAGYETVTVASTGTITVRDAVERLRRAFASEAPLVEVASRRPSFIISTTRATARFGFAPMTIAAALDRYAADVAGEIKRSPVLQASHLEGTN
jgi:nucleoside-diphosphate-sugar epimerase